MPVLTANDAAHLLRRVGFGGSAPEVAALTGLERSVAVDRVMDFSGAPAVVRPGAVDVRSQQWNGLVAAGEWWITRMATTPTPLQEKLTLFWHGHFATSQSKVGDIGAMFDQNVKLRAGALGSFRDLCQSVAIDPAMLVYLDNATNKAGDEQENFGRELMELFTLGVGNYTEADVISMAKAWTGHNSVGWNGSYYDPRYVFNAAKHDNTDKTLFGITRNWNGPEAIDEIVHGSKRAVCARFIARKLFLYFVHDSPSDPVLTELANAFAAGNMVIAPLVRAILLHDEFWAPATRHALVKSPIAFVVEVIRRTGLPVNGVGAPWGSSAMGQMLFAPPSVEGWGTNGYWLSTATAWAKSNWLAWMRWKTKALGLWNGLGALAPQAAVQRIFDDLGLLDATTATRVRLEEWVTKSKDGYMEGGKPTYDQGAVQVNALLLGCLSPEFLTA